MIFAKPAHAQKGINQTNKENHSEKKNNSHMKESSFTKSENTCKL